MEAWYCPGCRAERVVEQPPCPDEHAECPEWACVVCGTAIIAGWLEVDLPSRARKSSRSVA